MRTASPSARCRSKCSLSSREVKSTGENVRVVILPSTVMAKVAMTKGRAGFRDDDVDLTRPLFRFTDFMLEGGDFALHLAHAHMPHFAAWSVEEVNNTAGCGADEDDEKTHRADKFGHRDR